MFYVSYIPTKPQSNKNFEVGLTSQVWGVKESYKNSINMLKKDDLIAFVHGITWVEDKSLMPPGFSRVSKDNLKQFRGSVKKILIGKLTRGYYFSEDTVWEDDIYPHRFDFEITKEFPDNTPFGIEFFNSGFVEAVRSSACKHGSLIPCKEIRQLSAIYSDDHKIIEDVDDGLYVLEGKPILRLHAKRERNTTLIKRKKESTLQVTGKLECEVCGFEYSKKYGELGEGYIECHHNNPLSLNDDIVKTKLEDLTLLCSNCHRMIHRRKPWLTAKELKDIYGRT